MPRPPVQPPLGPALSRPAPRARSPSLPGAEPKAGGRRGEEAEGGAGGEAAAGRVLPGPAMALRLVTTFDLAEDALPALRAARGGGAGAGGVGRGRAGPRRGPGRGR